MSNLDNAVTELTRIISLENDQLRQGNYRGVEETNAAKLEVLTRLQNLELASENQDNLSAGARTLRELRLVLDENGLLMKTAIKSVKFAVEQISSIRNMEAKVGTYSRFGKTVHVPESTNQRTKLV